MESKKVFFLAQVVSAASWSLNVWALRTSQSGESWMVQDVVGVLGWIVGFLWVIARRSWRNASHVDDFLWLGDKVSWFLKHFLEFSTLFDSDLNKSSHFDYIHMFQLGG